MSTKISWTDETWNPVHGCTKLSAGCKNCYAERMSKRLAGRHGYPPAPDNFKVTLRPDRLEQPLKWRKPRRVFVCSMSDLFHDDVPFDFIRDIWNVMETMSGHTFQVLTKRPHRMLDFLTSDNGRAAVRGHMEPLPNIWLGVTAENQQTADERIPLLLQTPAAVRFVSCEPLLGAVNLQDFLGYYREAETVTDFDGHSFYKRPGRGLCHHDGIKLDLVITGGESGPGARPMHPDWARGLRDQCQAAGVAYHFKQWGEWIPQDHWDGSGLKYEPHFWPGHIRFASYRVGNKRAGHLLDGVEWREMPEVTK